jgi:hypothetical protein
VPPPYPLRPLALEFRVTGSLDGVTPSPEFAIPPAAGSPVVPTENKVVIEVDNLGLIDLTGLPDGRGQYANRIIKWLMIFGPNVPFSTDNVGISFDGVPEGTDLSIPPAANGIRSYVCLLVPQSGQLRVNGMAASATEPVVVRIGVWQPQSLLEYTEMIDACCCIAEDPELFLQAFYTAENCARTLTSVNPGVVIADGTQQQLTLGGTGFTDGDEVAIISADGTATLPIASVTVVTQFQIIVQVVPPGTQALGNYDVTVSAALGGPSCSATLDDAVQVVGT